MRRFLMNHGLKYFARGSIVILIFAIISFVIAFIYHSDIFGFLSAFGIPIAFLLGVLNRVLSLWLRQDMKRDSCVNVPIVIGIGYFIFLASIFYVAHKRAEAEKAMLLYNERENLSTDSNR